MHFFTSPLDVSCTVCICDYSGLIDATVARGGHRPGICTRLIMTEKTKVLLILHYINKHY